MPPAIDYASLDNIQPSEADARKNVERALETVADFCGFLCWISSVSTKWQSALMNSELVFLESLKLQRRQKRGALYKLSKDYHVANFEYLVQNGVPFHYPWTPDEMGQGRFVRYSPRYVGGLSAIRLARGDVRVDPEELSFFEEIKDDLNRYDEFFQDIHSERRGVVLTSFDPSYHYYEISFLGYGARSLENWNEIRACAERFKCTKAERADGTSITFFRQSPLSKDTPLSPPDSHLPNHRLTLEDRLSDHRNYVPAHQRYSYRRRSSRSLSPARVSAGSAHDSYIRTPTRRSVSVSTVRSEGRERSRSSSSSSSRASSRSDRSATSERSMSYEPSAAETDDRDHDREEEYAAETREVWITDDNHEPNNLLRVTEIWPTRVERPDPVWNKSWLDRAILVFKDPRTHVRMKLIANCFCDVDCIEDVLTAAWKFGLPFQLFLPESETRFFADRSMSRMDELALPKLYGSGFTERFLTKAAGPQAQYAAWIVSASEVVRRPNAVAFIAEGGIVSEIAQVIDPSLIHRFTKGPSVQVTEFSKGEKFLQRDPPEGERRRFFTADCVSEAEISILLGHIPGENSDKDRTLFPRPASFEEYSDHCRGMVGVGALKILTNLVQKAERNPKWLTDAQWKSYLRSNNYGLHAPTSIPTTEDFNEVGEMIRRAFPINWQHMPVSQLRIPEIFDPRAHRT
ncbi:hypothetical protein DFH08DRAFT_706650 [Mycena albidolilacea]|uniref:Uncharacterized protein n=1 Tax=Mycena albidolilacea TaxID=1033008 RepID=A0AAD6ZRZ6_9AGAR|nr:hypothetical protein DFH08DRAFT_706650 [Mycena albidolilacea]